MALHASYNCPQVPKNCSHSYNLPTLLKTPTCYTLSVSLIFPPPHILPPPQLPLVTAALFVVPGWEACRDAIEIH